MRKQSGVSVYLQYANVLFAWDVEPEKTGTAAILFLHTEKK